ncbi:MAG: hypothetical protein ACRDTV_14815 [Mycobacterium sp.]
MPAKVAQALPAQFLRFVAALAPVDTLDTDTAANAVDGRLGASEARAAEIAALHNAGVTPTAADAVAFDYLLATLQAEVSCL